MKSVVVFALVAGVASAFQPPTMTFAVGKAPPKAVTKAVKSVKASATKAVNVAKKEVKTVKATIKKAAPKPMPKMSVTKPVALVKKEAKKVVKAVKKTAPTIKPVKAVKKFVRAAPAPKAVARKIVSKFVSTIPSKAIPYEDAPALLDGSLVGDAGFDPCFLSTKADLMTNYFNGIFNNKVNIDGITWYREAELLHGRICMIAVVGFIVPGFYTFPGNAWTGEDAYSYTNPLEAYGSAPAGALFQITLFMVAMEFRRITIIDEQGSNYMAGDSQRWGQGEGRWNPLGFNYTPEEYEEKQLQEIKHGRLAMIGFLGLVFQANASGINVVQQWSAAFNAPDYYAKAGYFFPEGI